MSLRRLEAAENRVGRAARQRHLTGRYSNDNQVVALGPILSTRSLSILEKIAGRAGGFLPAASSGQSSASITDTVTDDVFTVTVPGTDVGKVLMVLTGPRAGQTFKLEGTSMRKGLISADGCTLVTSVLTPAVETITYSNGDVERRICWRSRVLIKLDAD
jgi:hypothetical protein